MFKSVFTKYFRGALSLSQPQIKYMNPTKLASLFIATAFAYSYSKSQFSASSGVKSPKGHGIPFITSEDEDEPKKDWAEDGLRIFTVCVTGASGSVGYNFLPLLASGNVFGENIRVKLKLMDKPENLENLKGVAYELEDGCYPLLEGIKIGSTPEKLFKDCDLIVFIGGTSRQPGMTRHDLLKMNGEVFKKQGEALNKVASTKTRCLVVANPPNTNAYILQKSAPQIPQENFTSLSRLDHNRAVAQLSMKLNKPCQDFANMIVWGNHSGLIYPDMSSARVEETPVTSLLIDDDYIDKEFVKSVQNRGDEILKAKRINPSVMSGASAIRDHIKDWWHGTEPTTWTSMGVISDGSYDVPEGLFFSFPCTTKYFRYNIVKGLKLSNNTRSHIEKNVNELKSEKDEANKILGV